MVEGEDAEGAVRREANEEMGVALDTIELVGRVWSSPGESTERQSLFLAIYATNYRKSGGGRVAGKHEGITGTGRPLAQLVAEVDQRRIADSKLMTLVLALRLRQPELFA